MLNRGREGLFELGQQLQQQGEYQAALHCFLSCLLGLTHVQSFNSLPNCLHQIAELFITEKNYGKALQFIQAEKMFYEVALIELSALQGSTGPQEEAMLGSAGWATPEELSEQASQAQHLERLAQLCIMSKQPHLALEYSGKATKIHQRTFGNDHPITARSLELMATVYAEIGKTEYSGRAQHPACTLTLQTHHPPLLLLLPSGVTSAFPCYKSLIPIDHSMSRVVYFDKPARRKPNTLLNAFERLAGSVCVRSVQTLRRRRVHQRHRQLSSTFPPGETLRGPSQEGPPPPTGGHAEGQGDQWQSPHLHFKEARSQLRVGHRAHPQAERRAAGSLQGAGDDGTRVRDDAVPPPPGLVHLPVPADVIPGRGHVLHRPPAPAESMRGAGGRSGCLPATYETAAMGLLDMAYHAMTESGHRRRQRAPPDLF
ncbi:nutritionally-regulated adipose and cardiac enriched protein homolog isoform X2 [Genypterus blacodes]|uniref:nutritionally-regulated adipose and cardiac enriched protein homolog isoform X2 n=1 Tax=Genypterus blacodes TaxID=154954 RepID=UPI003F75D92D